MGGWEEGREIFIEFLMVKVISVFFWESTFKPVIQRVPMIITLNMDLSEEKMFVFEIHEAQGVFNLLVIPSVMY